MVRLDVCGAMRSWKGRSESRGLRSGLGLGASLACITRQPVSCVLQRLLGSWLAWSGCLRRQPVPMQVVCSHTCSCVAVADRASHI